MEEINPNQESSGSGNWPGQRRVWETGPKSWSSSLFFLPSRMITKFGWKHQVQWRFDMILPDNFWGLTERKWAMLIWLNRIWLREQCISPHLYSLSGFSPLNLNYAIDRLKQSKFSPNAKRRVKIAFNNLGTRRKVKVWAIFWGLLMYLRRTNLS